MPYRPPRMGGPKAMLASFSINTEETDDAAADPKPLPGLSKKQQDAISALERKPEQPPAPVDATRQKIVEQEKVKADHQNLSIEKDPPDLGESVNPKLEKKLRERAERAEREMEKHEREADRCASDALGYSAEISLPAPQCAPSGGRRARRRDGKGRPLSRDRASRAAQVAVRGRWGTPANRSVTRERNARRHVIERVRSPAHMHAMRATTRARAPRSASENAPLPPPPAHIVCSLERSLAGLQHRKRSFRRGGKGRGPQRPGQHGTGAPHAGTPKFGKSSRR